MQGLEAPKGSVFEYLTYPQVIRDASVFVSPTALACEMLCVLSSGWSTDQQIIHSGMVEFG